MSHYLTIPINENGVITDTNIGGELAIGCSRDFGTTDVFLYSHGWWTPAIQAMATYNRFSIEFANNVLQAAKAGPALARFPAKSLGIGLHWPSMLSEDANSLEDRLEALSFYTMEKRADTVGEHGLYSIIRMAIETNQQAGTKIRFHLLGHSFGCKVVCSALQAIATDDIKGSITEALDVRVVLLQAAFENDALEAQQEYESVSSDKLNVKMLVTRSDLDVALQKQFPLAKTINIFARDRIALGAQGPSAGTIEAFGGCRDLTIDPGFTRSEFGAEDHRLYCANITPIHQRDKDQGIYQGDNFGGWHSDINSPELYELLTAFLFQ